MIKKFDEFSKINETFDWDEFSWPKVEELLSRGYETSSETYTPIWIGVPISVSEYENEWTETDWQFDQNLSFANIYMFLCFDTNEQDVDPYSNYIIIIR